MQVSYTEIKRTFVSINMTSLVTVNAESKLLLKKIFRGTPKYSQISAYWGMMNEGLEDSHALINKFYVLQ